MCWPEPRSCCCRCLPFLLILPLAAVMDASHQLAVTIHLFRTHFICFRCNGNRFNGFNNSSQQVITWLAQSPHSKKVQFGARCLPVCLCPCGFSHSSQVSSDVPNMHAGLIYGLFLIGVCCDGLAAGCERIGSSKSSDLRGISDS